jgi:hypothetical protein
MPTLILTTIGAILWNISAASQDVDLFLFPHLRNSQILANVNRQLGEEGIKLPTVCPRGKFSN